MKFDEHYKLFEEFFTAVDSAVKHIDHVEERIITHGKAGIDAALEHILGACNHFITDTQYKISLKVDGAPSIVCGIDNNKRFFVATKSIFTKSPKINYTNDDIERNHANQPGLVDKLKLALKYLPSLKLKGIYQLDYLFDNNIKSIESPQTIDGIQNSNKFVAFQPNTIKYACSPTSKYGEAIQKAKIGVAIHVEYEVSDGILKVKQYITDPREIKSVDDVFVYNVLVNKPLVPNEKLVNMVNRDIKQQEKHIRRLEKHVKFDIITSFAADLKSYINVEIRNGEFLENTSRSYRDFIEYMQNRKKITADRLELIKTHKKSFISILDITKALADLKNTAIKLFNDVTSSELLGAYLDKGDGNWQTTRPEGYAVSNSKQSITKLVNRQEFSHANFQNTKFMQPVKENTERTVCIAYGRMNPVTTGHEKLITVLSNTASKRGADCFIVPSHTQNNKKDPLSYDEKVEILQEVCPSNCQISNAGKTFMSLLRHLMEQGYNSVIHVAGSDRIPEFKAIIDQYNGKPDRSGAIPFQFDSYSFESAGERDPDSDDISGVSASKVRNAALNGDYPMFRAGLSQKINEQLARKTYDTIRSRIRHDV